MASLEQRNHRTVTSYRVVWYEDGRKQALTLHDAVEAARFRQLVEGSGERWPAGWQRPTKAAPPVAPTKLTFGAWAARAIANRSKATDRTKADYLRDLERHFADLAPIPLDELTDDDVTAWTANRRAAGLADKTVRNLHGFASSLYVDALRQYPPLVARNPFAQRLSDRASIKTEEMVFLTPQEFATVLAYVRDEYRPLIRFLVGTGLRFGEATALTVRDIELLAPRKTVTVTKAWKRTGTATWEIGEPKTRRSRRTISISNELVLMLAELTAGKRNSDLVFAGPHGLRLPHIDVYKRGWAPAVARARVCDACYEPQRNKRGLRPLTPTPCDHVGALDKTPRLHDLRHSHASWLISDGVPLAAISRRLGHSSITITVDRYGHLDPSLDVAVDASMERALRPLNV
jgi:integrase